MKAGFSNDEYGHIRNFRRKMYIHPEYSEKLSILIKFDQTEYRIFLSDDTITCYTCKQTGHTSNHCKNYIENKAELIHYHNPNFILDKNNTDLNKQKTQNTDNTHTFSNIH